MNWDAKRKKFIFYRKGGFTEAIKCNQKEGAIMKLKEILDLQELQEAEALKAKKKK